MKIQCPECGETRVRAAKQVAALKSLVCSKCQNKDIKPTVCPSCGVSRKYPPSILKKLRSPVCRKCLHGHKPKVICVKCGLERYKGQPSIGLLLKTQMCRKCWKAEELSKWVTITCKQCGRERSMPPAEAAQYITGACLRCARHAPGVLPDNYDAGYLVGVILGDGSIIKKLNKNGSFSYIVCLSVTDILFADKFAETPGRLIGRKPSRDSRTRTTKGNPEIKMPPCTILCHRVQVTSRDWYDRLHSIKKDRDFSGVTARGIEFKKGFFQGLLDSEGYVNHRSGYTDIANKDLNLLALAVEVAAEIGYKAKVYGPYPYSRGVAHLRIGMALEKTATPKDRS